MACLRTQQIKWSSRLAVTSGKISGSVSSGFSSDFGILSVALRFNFASSGSLSITIYGARAGLVTATSAIRLGISACERTTWAGDTAVRCLLSHGIVASRKFALTAGIRIGTETVPASIDVGMISVFRRGNRGSTGSASVTVHGYNMGLRSFTSALALRRTSTERTAWASDTAMRCTTGAGRAQSAQITFSAGIRVGSATELWTFDSGSASASQPSNRAGTGSTSFTIVGLDLSSFCNTVDAAVGHSAFEASEWVSDTSVRSYSVAGIRASRTLVFTAVVQWGSLSSGFSVTAPSLAFVLNANMALTAANLVTIIGSALGGIFATTTKARAGGTAPEATLWTSQSSTLSLVAVGAGATRNMVMTVGERTGGSRTQMLSYSTPRVSEIWIANVPVTGSGSLTLFGSWFGMISDISPWVRMHVSGCEQTTWIAHSSVICRSPGGDGGTGKTTVSAGRRAGTRTAAMTYAVAVASSARRSNTAASGAFVIGVLAGRGFAPTLTSLASRMHLSACETTIWSSDTSVTLLPSNGVRISRSIALTVGGKVGSMSAVLSFDRPTVDRFYQPGEIYPEVLVGGSGYVDGGLDTLPSPSGPIGTAFSGSFTVINGLIDAVTVLVAGSQYTSGVIILKPVYRGTTMPQDGTVTDVAILERGINYVGGVVSVGAGGNAPGFLANFSVDNSGRVLAVSIVSHGRVCGPSSQLPMVASYMTSGPSMDGTVTGVSILNGGANYISGDVIVESQTGSGLLASFTVNSSGAVTAVVITNCGSGYPAAGAVVRLRYSGGGTDMTNTIAAVVVGSGGTGFPANGGSVVALGGGGAGFQGEFDTELTTGAITAVRVLSPGFNYTSDPLILPVYRGSTIPMDGTIAAIAVAEGGRNYLGGGIVDLSGSATGTGFMGVLVAVGGSVVAVEILSNGQGVPVSVTSSDVRIYYPGAVLCGNITATAVCLQAGSVTGVIVSGSGNQHYAAGPANVSCLPPCVGVGFAAKCNDVSIYPSGAGDGIIDSIEVSRNLL